jgi:hypothetical protein
VTTTRAPLWVARNGVALAVRGLPQKDDRLRYRAELLAELHDLTPAAQLRYTAGAVSQMFALRAALSSSPTRAEEAAMTLTTSSRVPFLRCRVFHWHRWVTRSTEDGDRYSACAACGRLLHDGATSGPNSRGFSSPSSFI